MSRNEQDKETSQRIESRDEPAEQKALREWIPEVYKSACEHAHTLLARWWGTGRPDTASLVDRAVCKLLECGVERCASRRHALNILARTMRWTLSDAARAAQSAGMRRVDADARKPVAVSLNHVPEPALAEGATFLSLHDALERLDSLAPRLRQVVELRYLLGLTIDETAAELGISTGSVSDDTRLAKAWLYNELGGRDGHQGASPDG